MYWHPFFKRYDVCHSIFLAVIPSDEELHAAYNYVEYFFFFLQQFPQLDKEMVQVLQASLDHYQQLKMMEDMLKDDDQTKKVQNRI